MKFRAAINAKLGLATAALIVAVVVVASTVDFKFSETTKLQPNSPDANAAASGSASTVTSEAVDAPVMGEQSQSLSLSFSGPFSPEEIIKADPIATPWLKNVRIRFPRDKYIDINGNGSELGSSRLIHYFITVTDLEGHVHTVVDQKREAPSGPRTDLIAGSWAGTTVGFDLPIPLASITKMNMRFTPVERHED